MKNLRFNTTKNYNEKKFALFLRNILFNMNMIRYKNCSFNGERVLTEKRKS